MIVSGVHVDSPTAETVVARLERRMGARHVSTPTSGIVIYAQIPLPFLVVPSPYRFFAFPKSTRRRRLKLQAICAACMAESARYGPSLPEQGSGKSSMAGFTGANAQSKQGFEARAHGIWDKPTAWAAAAVDCAGEEDRRCWGKREGRGAGVQAGLRTEKPRVNGQAVAEHPAATTGNRIYIHMYIHTYLLKISFDP